MDEDLAARDSQLRSELASAAAEQRATSAGLIDAELTAALTHARAEIHMRDTIISSQSALIADLADQIAALEQPEPEASTYSRAADRLRPAVDRLPSPVKSAAYGASHVIRKLGSRR